MQPDLQPQPVEPPALPAAPAAFSLPVLLVVAAAALAVVLPFCFLGNASGHDFEFHLASWIDVAQQWKEGVFYPRWAALANYGYGEPRFIFYPPASWMLGAALSFLLPWKMVPGAYLWLVLTVAGLCMFRLAADWMPPRDALFAAVLYAVNPYHLLIAYCRSDFAEMLGAAIFPLAVRYAIRAGTEPRRAFAPLALVTAATWLANAPAGVMLSYSLALLLAVTAWRGRSLRVLLFGGGAMALGFTLAAFYIVPAAFEQAWVNIAEVLSSGLRPQDNFLFTTTRDPEHTLFNYLASKTAVVEIGVTGMALVFSARLRRHSPRAWWLLLALAAASTALMLPLTSPAWSYLPKLRFVQFPWRWLFALGVPFAFLAAAALEQVRLKPALWAMALAALALGGFAMTNQAWWDPGGVTEFHSAALESGYEGTDEYGPRGSDHYDLKRAAPRVAAAVPPGAASAGQAPAADAGLVVHIHSWKPDHKAFSVDSSQAMTLGLRLLNYPAWRVETNGRAARAASDPQTGQMLIAVPAGHSRVRVSFARTQDRLWGGIVSVLAAAVLLAAAILTWQTACAGL